MRIHIKALWWDGRVSFNLIRGPEFELNLKYATMSNLKENLSPNVVIQG